MGMVSQEDCSSNICAVIVLLRAYLLYACRQMQSASQLFHRLGFDFADDARISAVSILSHSR